MSESDTVDGLDASEEMLAVFVLTLRRRLAHEPGRLNVGLRPPRCDGREEGQRQQRPQRRLLPTARHLAFDGHGHETDNPVLLQAMVGVLSNTLKKAVQRREVVKVGEDGRKATWQTAS